MAGRSEGRRRLWLALGGLWATFSLTGCGVSAKDHQAAKNNAADGWAHYRAAKAEVEEAESKFDRLASETQEVESAVSELRSQSDRFDAEDWGDVVADLQSAVDDVESAQADATDAAGQ